MTKPLLYNVGVKLRIGDLLLLKKWFKRKEDCFGNLFSLCKEKNDVENESEIFLYSHKGEKRKLKQDEWYSTQRWKDKRAKILRRDGYKDQLELRAGKNVEANTVHHILPRDKYPQYAWEDWNLISVSEHTHKYELHDKYGGLTEAGTMLMLETAHANDIKLSEVILICGMPASGKTTLAKKLLKNDLCYDLDYIAGAFRLSQPKTNDTKGARKLANSMVRAFSINAKRYAQKVYIIRTAPTQSELDAVEPDKIIICKRKHEQKLDKEVQTRLKEIEAYAIANRIDVQIVNND